MPITDRVRFAGRSFDLVRIVGDSLFEPATHGIEVVTGLSPCPRGWYGVYALDGALILDRLHVRLTDDARPPRLDGVCPTRRQRRTQRLVGNQWQPGVWPTWDHAYRNLRRALAFTGSLWLGTDRVRGFNARDEPLLAYRTVWDVMLDQGVLAAAIDRSGEVAGARAQRWATPHLPIARFDRQH